MQNSHVPWCSTAGWPIEARAWLFSRMKKHFRVIFSDFGRISCDFRLDIRDFGKKREIKGNKEKSMDSGGSRQGKQRWGVGRYGFDQVYNLPSIVHVCCEVAYLLHACMALSVSHDHAHYPLIHTATYSIKKVSDEELVEWLGSDNGRTMSFEFTEQRYVEFFSAFSDVHFRCNHGGMICIYVILPESVVMICHVVHTLSVTIMF